MFGYFRPYHANLTYTERTIFNSYYCRVCYCLRIIGGQMARFCTTYDAAVYGLVLALQSREELPPTLPCERLGVKNLKHYEADGTGLWLARLSLISVGEKFRDDSVDGNGVRSRILSAPLKRAIRRAAEAEPELARRSFEGTERINRLQCSDASVYDVLAAYGDMAESTFSLLMEMTPDTARLVRSISEWNFFMDMICDYADDCKSGAYNGFKKEGLPTFSAYFNYHYREFMAIADTVTSRLQAALLAVRDDSAVWNTLFKIIVHAIDNVLPAAIGGEDVSFHYFPDLFERIRENGRLNSDIKRLGIKRE